MKVVVFNNGALGFVELEQKSTGFLDFGTELDNPNFAAMAEAIGIRGIRLEDPAEVDDGIAAALRPRRARSHRCGRQPHGARHAALRSPPEMAKGFTLYMLKAVISGRGDEIIDLAKTNLWR